MGTHKRSLSLHFWPQSLYTFKTNVSATHFCRLREFKFYSDSINSIHSTYTFLFFEVVWSLPELATKVGVSADFLKRKIIFWVHNGVLQDIGNDVYQLQNNPHAITNESGFSLFFCLVAESLNSLSLPLSLSSSPPHPFTLLSLQKIQQW
jgi:hypothetical protein